MKLLFQIHLKNLVFFFFPVCLESFLSTILLIENSLNKLFPIPVGVANRIEKIQPEFLWGWSGR